MIFLKFVCLIVKYLIYFYWIIDVQYYQVIGVQHSDSLFLKVILLIVPLQNIGYICCAVEYILVVYFIHVSLYLLIPHSSLIPSPLSSHITVNH